jgi:threonine synthase
VAEQFRDTSVPLLSLSTAHPAKFDNVMALALPDVAVNHPTLDALNALPTRKTVLPVSIEAVKALIRE